jgi:hypothetical protein
VQTCSVERGGGAADEVKSGVHETTGGFGPEALQFIKSLIKLGAEAKMVFAPRDVVQGIYRSVAVAVARGNAHIIERNLRRSNAANGNGGELS